MHIGHLLTLFCILTAHSYFDFCNSEVMTSLPHNIALDSQPRFQPPSAKVSNNLCNPILLKQ